MAHCLFNTDTAFRRILRLVIVAAMPVVFPAFVTGQVNTPDKRPNIVLIMADDMGYSDIGCFGGEISTPNIDRLADNGLKYTQFYNSARCCPTRASLMTGLYPHQAGMGWMTAVDHNLPGYEAELNNSCVTIAEVLKDAGYETFMTGKWHLAKDPVKDPGNHNWPLQRGFEKYYGILIGASNFYDPGALCRDNTFVSPYTDPAYKTDSYYLTDAISDNSVQYIRERDKNKPFFMYVAYTAAHWPMQAPEEAIGRYKGVYDNGWEEVRRKRFEKMKKYKLIDDNTPLPDWEYNDWKSEEKQTASLRRMETYAAMVDVMDQGIGRIISSLKEENIFENTVIIYLQDNGACAEMIGLGKDGPVHPNAGELAPLAKHLVQTVNKPPVTRDGKPVMQGTGILAGPADTYVAYGKEWAQVSNTPLRQYKHWVHEGGIATPMIVHWKKGIKGKGEFRSQPGHVIDIMPTLLDLAGAKYPVKFHKRQITPVEGISLVPTFINKDIKRSGIFWEHEMNRAVRMGKWKLVSEGTLAGKEYGKWNHYSTGPWELYDISKDRNEMVNLAAEQPAIVERMATMWSNYANTKKVFPAPWKEKTADVSRPNIVLIMADDLGFSDLGSYGSEIDTPNLDSLARNGLRFSQFYNTSRCCPTRAALLTGLYNHQAGVGSMTRDQQLPGYRGHLTENAVTLAEVLRAAGYRTAMTGKWHLSNTIVQEDEKDQLAWLNHQQGHPLFSPAEQYPLNRGFEKFYGTIWGVVDYFDPFSLVSGMDAVKTVPVNYYHTDAINDSAAAYIREFAREENPFFIYVAHNAPHWPVQALPDDIKKYEKTYTKGWNAVRQARFNRQVKEGLIDPANHSLSETATFADTAWSNNPLKEWDARAMAVHAAMVDRMDQGIGRIIAALKETGQFANTVIIFLSDNGASPEMCETFSPGFDRPGQTRDGKQIIYPATKQILPGPQIVFAGIGPEWAAVSNTPFRYWKIESYEGGVRTPMIVHWPAGLTVTKGSVTHQPGHVMDFMPTFTDLAQTDYPDQYNGHAITPVQGLSLLPVFQGKVREGHEALYNSHGQGRYVRVGDWKIVSSKSDTTWRLYNLKTDACEWTDMSSQFPQKVGEMQNMWTRWAMRNKVFPKP